MPKKPDAGAILALHSHLQALWSDTHKQWRQTDEFVHHTFQIWTRAEHRGRPSIHPSLSTSILNHAIDSQLSFTPRYHRPYLGTSEEKKEHADRIVEPWVNNAIEELALFEPLLTWKQVGRHLLAYGYAVVEGPIYTYEGRPEKPADKGDALKIWAAERRAWLPYRIHAPNPARILLDPTEKRPYEGVKATRRYNIHLKRLTERLKEDGQGEVKLWEREDYDLVDTFEYWSADWHALVAEGGQLLLVEPNDWHQMPYKHAFAGYGQEPTTEDNQNPKYLAQGVLHPVLESLKAHAQHVSGRHNLFMQVAFNDMITSGDAGELREQLAHGQGILEVPKGQEPKWMEIPNFPQWAIQSEQMLLQDIEQGTYASSLAGIRQEGVSTVGQQAILSTAASRKFEAPSKQLEHLATLVGQDLLRLVDMVGEPVIVRGITLHPSDLDHDYSLTCSFDLVNPVLQMQQKDQGMREVAMGLKSVETYWSADARLEDAAGERVRLITDQIRKLPEVQQLMASEVMREVGLAQALDIVPPDAAPAAGGAATLGGATLGVDGHALTPIANNSPQGLTDQVPGQPQAMQAFTGSLQGGIAPHTPASG